MTKVPCGKRTPWSSLSLSCTPIAPCHVHSATACYLVTCAVQPPVTLSHAQRNRWFPCHVRSVTACYLVKCTAQLLVSLSRAQCNRLLPSSNAQRNRPLPCHMRSVIARYLLLLCKTSWTHLVYARVRGSAQLILDGQQKRCVPRSRP